MDRWRYFAITHADHAIMNPLGDEQLDHLIDLLDLADGARVLDIGCGKGEALIRVAERYRIHGTGVDLSPHSIREARERGAARVPDAALEWIEADGAAYDAGPGSFDLAMCLGASWIWGGYRGTLRALRAAARPGGLVVSGEPYWRRTPEPEYLTSAGLQAETFGTHAGNVATGVDEGLIPLYTIDATQQAWDRYEGLQWRAAERFAVTHPEDPDAVETRDRQRHARDTYLRWGRDTLGWAVYLFARE